MPSELNAVVLWTGGKDSALALYRARERGLNIVALVTFVPDDGKEFQAHPQNQMKEQAAHLNLPIHFVKISRPYEESYVSALKDLKQTLKISTVVTGDIDEVDGQPNWIEACCRDAQLDVELPLWKNPREDIMSDLLKRDFKVSISWINHPSIPTDWKNRIIDEPLLSEMRQLFADAQIDLCGENGEYHTMVSWN